MSIRKEIPPQPIEWSPNVEKYLADIGERCECLAWVHKRAEAFYTARAVILDIPTILLSTIAGASSIGSSSLFPDNEKMASIIIGGVSISVGILQTINQQFSFGRRAENHKLAFVAQSRVQRNVKVQLSLPRLQRIPPKEMLQSVKDEYDRLAENAPLIDDFIIKTFKAKFKEQTEISKPEELNGLEKIDIYEKKWSRIADIVKGRRASVELQQTNEVEEEREGEAEA